MIWTTYRCPDCGKFKRAREGQPAPICCHGTTLLHQKPAKPPRSSFPRKPPEQEPTTPVRIPWAVAEAAVELHHRPLGDSVRLAAADGVQLGGRVLALEEAVTVALAKIEQLTEAVRDLERTRRQQRAEVSR